MARRNNFFRVQSTGCPDADVNNFFALSEMSEANLASYLSAKSFTYSELKTKVCEFITGLKADGTYNLWGAMYLGIGDTAAQKKWNFINPVDSDAAFRLNFIGGWSFTASACVPNGFSSYANTFFSPATNASINGYGFCFYGRDVRTSGVYGINSGGLVASHNFAGNCQITNNLAISYVPAVTPSTRLWLSRRTSNTFNESYRDGVSIGSRTALMATLPNIPFFYGAQNVAGSPALYNSNSFAFAGQFNAAVSNTQAGLITTRVNAFMLALNNNV